MKPYIALSVAATVVVVVALIASCDPQETGTPGQSVVVENHHHGPVRSTAPRTVPRSRTAPTVPRHSTTVAKQR